MEINNTYSSNAERIKAYKEMVEFLKIDKTIDIMLKEYKNRQEKNLKKSLINKEEKRC